jgi:hypothetical protein
LRPCWLHPAAATRLVLAQLAEFSKANDPDWIKDNPDAAMEMYKTHAEKVREFGACVHSPPPIGYTLKQLADWIEGKAKDKTRIIVADPITACKPEGREPWNEAQSFILRVKNAAAKYGCSIVLATHGRKGQEKTKGPPDMDSMAGGASYSRFASSVIWIDPLKDVQANVKAIQWGLKSRTQVVSETGGDIEDIFTQLQAENALAEEFDVEVSGPEKEPMAEEKEEDDGQEDAGGKDLSVGADRARRR